MRLWQILPRLRLVVKLCSVLGVVVVHRYTELQVSSFLRHRLSGAAKAPERATDSWGVAGGNRHGRSYRKQGVL